jgi:hypothetical protein
VINDIVLSGTDSTGVHVTTLYDTSAASESQLIGPGNEIEVYHLNYVSSGNKLMFDGLRFSDNKYIIGQVLLDGSNTLSAVTTGKWADFGSQAT